MMSTKNRKKKFKKKEGERKKNEGESKRQRKGDKKTIHAVTLHNHFHLLICSLFFIQGRT